MESQQALPCLRVEILHEALLPLFFGWLVDWLLRCSNLVGSELAVVLVQVLLREVALDAVGLREVHFPLLPCLLDLLELPSPDFVKLVLLSQLVLEVVLLLVLFLPQGVFCLGLELSSHHVIHNERLVCLAALSAHKLRVLCFVRLQNLVKLVFLLV